MGKTLRAILVTALLLVGGAAYALASSSGGRITACVTKKTGVLYVGKCKKHSKKLTWNAAGTPGPRGSAGATGPQGPGAKIFTYDAGGSANPTPQTLGTAIGDTWSADCRALPSGGGSLNFYLQTLGGAFDADVQSSSESTLGGASAITSLSHVSADPGTYSTPELVYELNVDNASSDDNVVRDETQIDPEGGYAVLSLDLETNAGNAPTCHVSVLALPASVAATTG